MQHTLDGKKQKDVFNTCVVCGFEYSPKSENQVYCSVSCRKYSMNETTKKRYKDLKKRVFDLYGNKCLHCGETDPIVLSLDHVEPIGKKRDVSSVLFSRILSDTEIHKNNYQLLCRNCNWRKMILNNERENSPPFAYRHELNRLENKINELSKKISEKSEKKDFDTTFYNTFEDIIIHISKIKNDIPLKTNGQIHSGKCIRWIKDMGFNIRNRDESTLINKISKQVLMK